MCKYRFVTDFEPSFPDIRKGFQKFEQIIKEDEVLKEIKAVASCSTHKIDQQETDG